MFFVFWLVKVKKINNAICVLINNASFFGYSVDFV